MDLDLVRPERGARPGAVCGQRRRRPARVRCVLGLKPAGHAARHRCASPPTGRRCSLSTRPTPDALDADRGLGLPWAMRTAGDDMSRRLERSPWIGPHRRDRTQLARSGRRPGGRACSPELREPARRSVGYDRCCALRDELARVAAAVTASSSKAETAPSCSREVSPAPTARKVAQLHDLSSDPRARQRPGRRSLLGRIAGQFAKPRSCVCEPAPAARRCRSTAGTRSTAWRPTATARRVRRRPPADRVRQGRGGPAPSAQPAAAAGAVRSHDALLCEFEEALVRIDPATRASGTRPPRTCCGWGSGRGTVDGPQVELLASRRQSGRGQARPGRDPRRRRRARRGARPRRVAGPAGADRAAGRRRGRAPAGGAGRGGARRRRAARSGCATRCTRNTFTPRTDARPARWSDIVAEVSGFVRAMLPRRRASGRAAPRGHAGAGDRMRRDPRRRHSRGRPAALSQRLRSAAQPGAGPPRRGRVRARR